ncbi:MAG: hypothetical protein KHY62_03840 [Firmicutes bacterium]|nr:hypothetical protein [Bacillota bacterium]
MYILEVLPLLLLQNGKGKEMDKRISERMKMGIYVLALCSAVLAVFSVGSYLL